MTDKERIEQLIHALCGIMDRLENEEGMDSQEQMQTADSIEDVLLGHDNHLTTYTPFEWCRSYRFLQKQETRQ